MRRRFLFILLLAVTLASRSHAQPAGSGSEERFAADPVRLSAELRAGTPFIVSIPPRVAGTLSLIATKQRLVDVEYVKRARAGSRARGTEYIDLVAVTLSATGSATRLDIKVPDIPPWGNDTSAMVLEIEISLPAGSRVIIDAPYFDVTAEGPLASVIDTTARRDMEILSVSDQTVVRTERGGIRLEKLQGTIQAETSFGELNAVGITQTSGIAEFHVSEGELLLEEFTGRLSVTGKNAKIRVLDCALTTGESVIFGDGAPVYMEFTKLTNASVRVSNDGDDIELLLPTDISAMLSVAVDPSSRIELNNLLMTPELVLPNRMNLRLGSGDSYVSANVIGRGNILIWGADSE